MMKKKASIHVHLFVYSGDAALVGENLLCVRHALPGAHLVVIDDGRHPCPDEVKAQAEELGAEWRVSFWERGGNLRGKACIEGMLGEMLRSMDDEGDTLVKIDADTVMVSGDDLLRFADRREMVFWGSGSVEQRVYGCLYALKAYAAVKIREYVRRLELLPDAPEDIVIGTSAFNLYPGEERHMVYAPFGPDAPDSGWTAYYWGRYPEVKGYQRFTMVTTGNPPPQPLDKRHRLPVMKNLRQMADIRAASDGRRARFIGRDFCLAVGVVPDAGSSLNEKPPDGSFSHPGGLCLKIPVIF